MVPTFKIVAALLLIAAVLVIVMSPGAANAATALRAKQQVQRGLFAMVPAVLFLGLGLGFARSWFADTLGRALNPVGIVELTCARLC